TLREREGVLRRTLDGLLRLLLPRLRHSLARRLERLRRLLGLLGRLLAGSAGLLALPLAHSLGRLLHRLQRLLPLLRGLAGLLRSLGFAHLLELLLQLLELLLERLRPFRQRLLLLGPARRLLRRDLLARPRGLGALPLHGLGQRLLLSRQLLRLVGERVHLLLGRGAPQQLEALFELLAELLLVLRELLERPLHLLRVQLVERLPQLGQLLLQLGREDLVVELPQLAEPLLELRVPEAGRLHRPLELGDALPQLLDLRQHFLVPIQELLRFLYLPVLHLAPVAAPLAGPAPLLRRAAPLLPRLCAGAHAPSQVPGPLAQASRRAGELGRFVHQRGGILPYDLPELRHAGQPDLVRPGHPRLAGRRVVGHAHVVVERVAREQAPLARLQDRADRGVGPIALQFERLLHRRLSVPQRAHAPAHQCGVAEAVIVPCVGRDRQAQVRAQQRVATRIRDRDLGRGVRHDGDVERGRRGHGFFALRPPQRPEVAAARPRCPAAREPVRLDIEPDLGLTLLGHEPCVLETPGGPAADVELGPRRDLERRHVALEALSRALEVCRVHHVHHEVGDEERVQRHDPERVAGGPVRRGHPVQHRHVDAREGAHRALARHGEDPLPGHVARGARVEHHLAPARRDDPDLEVGAARDFRVPRFDDQRRQRRGREMGYWVEERRPRGPRPLRGGEREGRGHGSEHQEQDQRALAPRPRQLAELAAQLEDARVRELALQRELGAPGE